LDYNNTQDAGNFTTTTAIDQVDTFTKMSPVKSLLF